VIRSVGSGPDLYVALTPGILSRFTKDSPLSPTLSASRNDQLAHPPRAMLRIVTDRKMAPKTARTAVLTPATKETCAILT